MANDWEVLGKLDPMWAILSEPERQFSRWDEEEFFATGQSYVSKLVGGLEALHLPLSRDRALDFGCGLGRIVRPLSTYFRHVVGLDCSASMISAARLKNRHVANCEFVECSEPRFPFPDNHFDLVHTVIVLQHLSNQSEVLSYVHEFTRTLRPGGVLVFQVPERIPVRKRVQLRRRLWSLLRSVGVSEKFLYNRLKLHPIRMTAVPRKKLSAAVSRGGCEIVLVNEDDGCAGAFIRSSTYFVVKRPDPLERTGAEVREGDRHACLASHQIRNQRI